MPYGVVPPRNTPRPDEKRRPCSTTEIEVNGVPVTAHFDEAPIQAHPVRLTIRSKIKLPDEFATYTQRFNNILSRFESTPKMKRSWRQHKVVYEGYITHTRLEDALRLIAEYNGVTATVVYL